MTPSQNCTRASLGYLGQEQGVLKDTDAQNSHLPVSLSQKSWLSGGSDFQRVEGSKFSHLIGCRGLMSTGGGAGTSLGKMSIHI